MPQRGQNREILFVISDVGRLLRTYADHKARQFGMTRAQWAVLLRLERHEGLKQSDLAEILDIQPITLTRLVDRLCANGLIERRADPNDRRAWRLYLTARAHAVVDDMDLISSGLFRDAQKGISAADLKTMMSVLARMKDNLNALDNADE
jgi:MarR family transcriptional regulator for hemolysin